MSHYRLDADEIKKTRARGIVILACSVLVVLMVAGGMIWVQLNTHVQVVKPQPGQMYDQTLWKAIQASAPTDTVRAILQEKPHLAFLALPNGRTPLHVAASEGRADLVALLLDHQASPNAPEDDGPLAGYTPLHAAASDGRAEVVKLLLARGAKPGLLTAAGRTALDLAKRENHPEVVEILEPVTPKR